MVNRRNMMMVMVVVRRRLCLKFGGSRGRKEGALLAPSRGRGGRVTRQAEVDDEGALSARGSKKKKAVLGYIWPQQSAHYLTAVQQPSMHLYFRLFVLYILVLHTLFIS